MAVTLEFRSRTAKLLQDQEKVIKQSKELPKGYKETAKEAAKAQRQVERWNAAALTPLERYNKKLKETALHLKNQRMTQDEARRAVAMHNRELQEAERAGKRAFGAPALAGLKSYAAGMLTVSGAVTVLLSSMREAMAERERAAQASIAARRGLGSLKQLAGSQAEYEALVGEARGIHAAGAAATQDEAGGVLFSLKSAGFKRDTRDLLVQARASDMIQDLAMFGRAIKTAQAAFGAKAGSPRNVANMAIAAAGESPATVEAITEAAAESAPFATQLGIDPRSVFAATSVLATRAGTAAKGGTQVSALLGAIFKANLGRGRSFEQLIIDLNKLAPEDLKDAVGGRKEALLAVKLLGQDIGEFRRIKGLQTQAVQDDLLAQKMGFTDPALRAARLRNMTEARVVQAEGSGRATNLLEAALTERWARMRASDSVLTGYNLALEQVQMSIRRMFHGDVGALEEVQAGVQDPTLAKEIRDFLSNIDTTLKDIKDSPAPIGRQE